MLKNWIGVATVALVMGFGSTPLGAGKPAISDHAKADRDARQAPKLAASADSALKKGDAAGAIVLAEKVVALLPEDAAARLLLGRAYLSGGRFVSADTAFGDALALDPSLGRAAMLRAFAQIANGHEAGALASLDAARGLAPESEIGLALAMMGRDGEAQARLQGAARAKDADARSRQNLAFAHALQGRWADAAAVAAQDVPPDQLPARLQRWAMIAQLRSSPAMQVGAMFGVLPAQDAGQPAMLALARPVPGVEPVMAAAPQPLIAEASKSIVAAVPLIISPPVVAARAPLVVPPPVSARLVAPASVLVASAVAPTQAMPLPIMAATPVAAPYAVAPTPAVPAPIVVASIAPVVPAKVVAPIEAPKPLILAPVRKAVAQPSGPLAVSVAIRASVASQARRAEAIKASFAPVARVGGQWVVQLGAFSTEGRTSVAWTRISSRADFLGGHQPVKGSFRKGNATLHRLSIGGFATRNDAVRVCLKLRAMGSSCFVRGNLGDRTLRMAQGERTEKAVA